MTLKVENCIGLPLCYEDCNILCMDQCGTFTLCSYWWNVKSEDHWPPGRTYTVEAIHTLYQPVFHLFVQWNWNTANI